MSLPSVSLVSDTDNRLEAWLISRPNIEPENFDESSFTEKDTPTLNSADFGINDQRRVTLHFRSSVLFRELLMTVRGLDPWAQTSRVKPIGETKVSGEYDESSFLVSEEKIQNAANSDKPQDIARLGVPVTASTEYVCGGTQRTWIAFLKCLKSRAPWMFEVYGQLIMDALNVGDLDNYAYDKHGGMEATVAFTEEDYLFEDQVVTGLGKTSIKFTTTLGHASHFVRHAHNMYKSTIWDLVEDMRHEDIDLTTPVTVITTMTEGSYKGILSHRAEWLADWNLWSNFIEVGTKDLTTEEFWNLLDTPYNFLADNLERIELTDPNIPDPRILECPELLKQRIQREGRTYISDRWEELYTEGYLTFNNSNEHLDTYTANLIAAGRSEEVTW